MADMVTVGEITYTRRNPWGVFALSVITFGIYFLVWYYKINNEMKNHGTENNPTAAVLAVSVGALIIVPPFVSLYKTADRILETQKRSGAEERIIPVLALLLFIVVSAFALPYYQTQLNKAWDTEARRLHGDQALPTPRPQGRAETALGTELRQLDQLRRDGLITDEEYEAKKRQILGI